MTFTFNPEFTGTIEGSQMAPIADYYRGIIGAKASIYTTHWGGRVQLKKADVNDPVELELPPALDKYRHFLYVIEGKCASVADATWGEKIVHILSSQAIASAVSGEVVMF